MPTMEHQWPVKLLYFGSHAKMIIQPKGSSRRTLPMPPTLPTLRTGIWWDYSSIVLRTGRCSTGCLRLEGEAVQALICPEIRSVSINGIQFYGSTSYYLSTTAQNATGTNTLTWGAYYQNIYNLPQAAILVRFVHNYLLSLIHFTGGATNAYSLGIFTPIFYREPERGVQTSCTSAPYYIPDVKLGYSTKSPCWGLLYSSIYRGV